MHPKHLYTSRYVWAYVTRYPGVSPRAIAGSQTQYTREEINSAIADLCARGYIQGEYRLGFIYYSPIIPFVLQAPEWASR